MWMSRTRAYRPERRNEDARRSVPRRFTVNKRGLALPSSTSPAGRFIGSIHHCRQDRVMLCHGLSRSLRAGLIAVGHACVQEDDMEEDMEEPPSVKPPVVQLAKEKKQKKSAAPSRRKVNE
jgi:hypothetical protein